VICSAAVYLDRIRFLTFYLVLGDFMRLLLVEDDELLAQKLASTLTSRNYVVDVARDGEEGWHYSQSVIYDLIVLDVSLPKRDGISLCQNLRDKNYQGAILLLTARSDNSEKVRGLDAGADDYVIKPCTIDELCARIRALLRRRDALVQPILTWGQLKLDPSNREVVYHDLPLNLSAKEYSLLELLIRHPRRIFSSGAILEHLWSFDDLPGEETVRAHVKRLRKKLKAVSDQELIETVYGMGYRLANITPQKPASAQDIRATVASAWDTLKAPIEERLNVLKTFINYSSEDNRQAAESAAHKLAGSLGMFGFERGSILGREIENCLQEWHKNTDLALLNHLIQELEQELQSSPKQQVSQQKISVDYSEPINILVIDDDLSLGERLQVFGKSRQMKFITAVDIDSTHFQLASQSIHVIILDLALSNGLDEGFSLLEELSLSYPQIPLLVLTVNDGFQERLEVARRGAKSFFSKSIPPDRILAKIEEIVYRKNTSEPKILSVDDDHLILASLQRELTPWGLQITTLSEPNQFWQTLNQVKPDLLLLDVELPNVSGIELCRVVRQDYAWDDLPILFLTSRQDGETIEQIFSAGADDYISKPFSSPELIARIFNRLERHRLLKNLQACQLP
jgi:DNA-binding response OmpR family regulator/HPt (histidine-containing phosphotransfer) domain-containing protein